MQRIKKAYAENGDLKIIPETPPLDGSENWEQGRGAYYELDNDPNTGDPLALDIDREQDNYFKNVISKNIKHWQENSFPIYFDDIAYPKNAIVKYTDGNNYVSLVNNNTQIPTGANWKIFDITSLDNTVKLTGSQTIAGVKTFSSSPIVPTPSTGTQAVNKDYADLKVALTQFTGTNQSLALNGYQKLPGGLIIQWGIATAMSANEIRTIMLPTAMPNGVKAPIATGDGEIPSVRISALETTTFSIQNLGTALQNAYWHVIGY